MHNEIKANAASVPSTLGGGAHGLISLVLTLAEYVLVSATYFDHPAAPAPLDIPPNATQHLTRTLVQTHERDSQVYHTVIGVQKALCQQIVATVKPPYLL